MLARTETSELSRSPEFALSSFVLRLPQPLAGSPADQPLLQVQLFAAPSIDGPGSTAASSTMDELVGSGVVQCRPDMAARLLRGERVTTPVVLTDAVMGLAGGAGAESGLSSLAAGLASLGVGMGGGGRGREVLLELLLLDAHLVLPRDAFALKASYAGAPAAAAADRRASGAGGSAGGSECVLRILVSRAENLPLVMGEGGVEVEPDTFVAAKRLRDGREGGGAQALTRTVAGTRRPVWNQALELRYSEAELAAGEQLLLALVNNSNSRLMIKAALPLAPLVPDHTYNLRLLLPGGPLGSAVHLYVSLVLTGAAAAGRRHLRAHMAAAQQLLQARLADSSATALGELVPPGRGAEGAEEPELGSEPPGGDDGEVFGVWRVVGSPEQAAEPPALPDPDPYTSLDTSSEAAVRAALQKMADSHAAAVQAATLGGGSALEVTPLRAAGGQDPQPLLWPHDHMVSMLAGAASSVAPSGSSSGASGAQVLQLALYHLPPPTEHPGPAPGPRASLTKEERLLGSGPVGNGEAAGAQGGRRQARLLGLAATPLQPRPAAGLGPGQVQLVKDVPVQAVPSSSSSPPSPKPAAEVRLDLELRRRDTAAVVASLEQQAAEGNGDAASPGGNGGGGGSGLGSADMASSMTWQGQAGALAAAAAGGAGGGPNGPVVEALVEDCVVKQGAVGRLIRQLDAAASTAEVASWRVADAESRVRAANDDNAKLRQLLHEEKEAWRIPQLLPDAASLSRDELVERCESAMAAYGRERRRNAELVHRLQQLHAEQVDTLELKKRYQQLQDAHMEQARNYGDLEGVDGRSAALRATIKTQEEVIRNLEALLAAAVDKAKAAAQQAAELKGAAATAEALREDMGKAAHLLQEQEKALQQSRAEAAHADQEAQQLRTQLAALAGEDQARAAGLEQQATEARERVAQLESELERARQQAAEAEQRVAEAEQRTAAAEQRVAEAEQLASKLRAELEEAQKNPPPPAEVEQPAPEVGAAPAGEGEGEAAGGEGKGEGEAGATVPSAELEAAQARIAELDAELEAAKARIAELEAELEAGKARVKELEEAPGGPEEVSRLEGEVVALTEEKTAGLLRAEYAEGAAEAAQAELIDVTKKFAREIAELKTRLAEKDAALMGGFGDLDQLRRGELPHLDMMGTGGLGAHGGPPQTPPPPPGMIMPNHQQARRPSGSPSTGARPPLQRVRSDGGSRGGTPPTGERAGSAGTGHPDARVGSPGLFPPIKGGTAQPDSHASKSAPPAPSQKAPPPAPPPPARLPAGRRVPSPQQQQQQHALQKPGQPAPPMPEDDEDDDEDGDEEDEDDDEEDDEEEDDDDDDDNEDDDEPMPPARGRGQAPQPAAARPAVPQRLPAATQRRQ
ncbi:hypothetical protein HYH02_011248 [Chlamydomonas schloesseri]|uniref:C2 domain-containing protein n=1 Tax=Chlamydomonas schloesseri TaxID=2026947 RepID=A0A835W523_9CHLO|nr:hypothetical protein HYH02_011248 [Chlamydomonas schloesseri]|eukprot:KAG2437608.1 hypothetical protein HYH02_011248 [Chlamydomonas schloesseri]